jgi:hypothetical protein
MKYLLLLVLFFALTPQIFGNDLRIQEIQRRLGTIETEKYTDEVSRLKIELNQLKQERSQEKARLQRQTAREILQSTAYQEMLNRKQRLENRNTYYYYWYWSFYKVPHSHYYSRY